MRLPIFPFLAFMAVTAAVPAPGNDLSSTLDRLESACAAFGKHQPKSMRTLETVTEFDSKWNAKSTHRIDKTVTFRDSVPEETIVRAVKNEDGRDEDVTKETRGKQEKEAERARKRRKDGKESGGGGSFSMQGKDFFVFNREARDAYAFSWIPDTVLGGRPAKRLLAVPKEADEKRYIVEYTLHPDSLAVTSVRLRPSRNPKMVRQLTMVMDFSADAEGRTFLSRFWTRFYVNAVIKKIRMEIEDKYQDVKY